jgi:hypothetical protein
MADRRNTEIAIVQRATSHLAARSQWGNTGVSPHLPQTRKKCSHGLLLARVGLASATREGRKRVWAVYRACVKSRIWSARCDDATRRPRGSRCGRSRSFLSLDQPRISGAEIPKDKGHHVWHFKRRIDRLTMFYRYVGGERTNLHARHHLQSRGYKRWR